jgi:alpha-N-arabinofuranosidase
MLDGGGHVVAHSVKENPVIEAEPTAFGSQYEALATTAVLGSDGGLVILVVNRHPTSDVTAQVVPAGFRHSGTATVSTVIGENDDPNRESYESHNSINHPDEVQLNRAVQLVGNAAFPMTFPKHSVTLIELGARR